MKLQRMLFAGLLVLPLAGFAGEESLTLDKVPAPVAKAIKADAGEEKVKIKAEKEDGIDAFEAKWMKGGMKHEITVAADGTVISQEEVIALESAPAAVQAAIKAAAAGAEIEAIEKGTTKEGTLYEAKIEGKEGDVEIKFDATGKEITREVEKEEKEEHGKKDKEEDDDDDDDKKGGEKGKE